MLRRPEFTELRSYWHLITSSESGDRGQVLNNTYSAYVAITMTDNYQIWGSCDQLGCALRRRRASVACCQAQGVGKGGV
jgi:hypothetical protein